MALHHYIRNRTCIGSEIVSKKEPARQHALTYATELIACPERKSIEPIAVNLSGGIFDERVAEASRDKTWRKRYDGVGLLRL